MKRSADGSASRTPLRSPDNRWSFNLASESLFPLGATEQVRRVAYRGADGQIRFLPTRPS